MGIKAQFENVTGKINELEEYIADLDNELSELISKLEDATQEDALEICREVSGRLDKFYQAI